MEDEPRARSEARRPVFRRIAGPVPSYQTGAGCSTVFWVVIAIVLLIVGLATSGIVSDVFWGLAALMGLLAAINLASVVTGHGGGGWTSTDVRPQRPQPPA